MPAIAIDPATAGTTAGLPADVLLALKGEKFHNADPEWVAMVRAAGGPIHSGCPTCGMEDLSPQYCQYCGGEEFVSTGEVWEAVELLTSACQREHHLAEIREVLLRRATSGEMYTSEATRRAARIGHAHARLAWARAAVELSCQHGTDPQILYQEERRAMSALDYVW